MCETWLSLDKTEVLSRHQTGYSPGTRLRYSPGTRLRYSPGTRPRYSPGPRLRYSPGPRLRYSPGTRLRYSPGTRLRYFPGPRLRYSPGTRLRYSEVLSRTGQLSQVTAHYSFVLLRVVGYHLFYICVLSTHIHSPPCQNGQLD